MSFEYALPAGSKLLKCGYTTGSCAALATMGAARLLLGLPVETLCITTPAGPEVCVRPDTLTREKDAAVCGIKKYAGDDIDVTAGLEIFARVTLLADRPGTIAIEGGEGVGRVTLPGLDRAVGEAAINTVPRRMITEACTEVCREAGYTGGLCVTVFVPGGKEAAQKTFNPRLGIVDGISILGTGGIVRPQSLYALQQSIEVEIRQKAAEGHTGLILCPGNYGETFVKQQLPDAPWPTVVCSNFVGTALDAAAAYGIKQVLLVGHIGKLIKLAGGIMDTHSRTADCRTELMALYAGLCGADAAVMEALLACATTDACLDLLEGTGLKQPVLERILAEISRKLAVRTGSGMVCGCWLFSLKSGSLGRTEEAEKLLKGMQAHE